MTAPPNALGPLSAAAREVLVRADQGQGHVILPWMLKNRLTKSARYVYEAGKENSPQANHRAMRVSDLKDARAETA